MTSRFHVSARLTRVRNIATACVRSLVRNEDGVSAISIALVLPSLIGAMGLAAEVSYWRLDQRAMQNASDAAAIAAATNATSSYVGIGKAVSAQYGFSDGARNVTVTMTNPDTAGNCTSNCYVATITINVPLFLSQVIGFAGTTTVNGQPATTIAATSVATSAGSYPYCLLALANSGITTAINANGAPFANLSGCNVMSNTGANCNGHNLNANVGDAHTTNSGCAITRNNYVPTVGDPYSGLASKIPTDSCSGSYPQEPAHHNDPALPSANKWQGSNTYHGVKVVCGDQQLTGDTTLNDTILVVENGQLDTNGYKLQGSGLTVVFTGGNNASYQHTPTGGGTLDITPPNSGDWSGVAIYQDPGLTTNVNISAAGNSPTWNISGLVYLPHSSVTLSGAVNKSSNGANCFVMVMDNITINGTGDIFANGNQCSTTGLNTLPQGGHRGVLVN